MAKPEKPLKEQVPQELRDYLFIFDMKTTERFPKLRPWDHTINLKPDFVPRVSEDVIELLIYHQPGVLLVYLVMWLVIP